MAWISITTATSIVTLSKHFQMGFSGTTIFV